MEGTIRRNRLTRSQSSKLVLWLNANKETLKTHAASLTKAAEMANTDLHFQRMDSEERTVITQKTIVNVLAETPEVDWRIGQPITELQALTIIAGNVARVMKQANVSPCVDLLRIANGQAEFKQTNGVNSIRNLFPETCEG